MVFGAKIQVVHQTFLFCVFLNKEEQFPLHVITHLARWKTATVSASLTSLARAVLFLGVYPASAMASTSLKRIFYFFSLFQVICNWWKLTGRTSEKQLTLTVLGCLVGATLFVESPGRRSFSPFFHLLCFSIFFLGQTDAKLLHSPSPTLCCRFGERIAELFLMFEELRSCCFVWLLPC